MALYHFHVETKKRSAGHSAVAAAAYRAAEKLRDDYYGTVADYSHKGGVVLADILLPSHVPRKYADRETLWNDVEKIEKHPKAQLAFSFDIALQNELTMEENITLARKYLTEQFVSKGMIVDFAVHAPEKEEGGIDNPHFHVLCPIRLIDENGQWGTKERREYELDEHGERIRDEAGNYVWHPVPTTDWWEPETLQRWREEWANYVNRAFEEKGLPCRIDHRSYEAQGKEQLPTVHEGPAVREMEKRGIRTDKGEWNRLVRSVNAMLRNLGKQIKELLGRIAEIDEIISRPQSPNIVSVLGDYYTKRNAGAWSDKAKAGNLKKYAKDVAFLQQHGIVTLDDFRAAADDLRERVSEKNASIKAKEGKRKELGDLIYAAENYARVKPFVDGLKSIKFEKARKEYREKHDSEFRIYHANKRVLDKMLKDAQDKKLHIKDWKAEHDRLETEYRAEYEELKPLRDELNRFRDIQSKTDSVLREQEHTARQKKHDMEL